MFKFNKLIVISLTTFLSIFLIAGCQTAGSKKQSSAATNEKKVYSAQKGLTPKQRFSKALQYMEHGQIGQASAELKAYLAAIPTSKRAQSLLEQTTMDPSAFFPKDSFSVKLTSGESLSTLAKKYLGSALKFYALAKYNNISNPSRVNIGQSINIPLTKKAIMVRAEDSKTKPAVKPESGNIADTPKASDKQVKKPVVTADTLNNEIIDLVSKKNYKAAITKIEKLKTLGDLTPKARTSALAAYLGNAKQLSSSDKKKAAENYTNAADLNQINGEPLTAFNHYKTASNLDPDNARAMEEMLILQKNISDIYHREATVAKNNQELDVAIKKWDMVLEVDPEHASAIVERSRAIQLQEKLAKIKK